MAKDISDKAEVSLHGTRVQPKFRRREYCSYNKAFYCTSSLKSWTFRRAISFAKGCRQYSEIIRGSLVSKIIRLETDFFLLHLGSMSAGEHSGLILGVVLVPLFLLIVLSVIMYCCVKRGRWLNRGTPGTTNSYYIETESMMYSGMSGTAFQSVIYLGDVSGFPALVRMEVKSAQFSTCFLLLDMQAKQSFFTWALHSLSLCRFVIRIDSTEHDTAQSKMESLPRNSGFTILLNIVYLC